MSEFWIFHTCTMNSRSLYFSFLIQSSSRRVTRVTKFWFVCGDRSTKLNQTKYHWCNRKKLNIIDIVYFNSTSKKCWKLNQIESFHFWLVWIFFLLITELNWTVTPLIMWDKLSQLFIIFRPIYKQQITSRIYLYNMAHHCWLTFFLTYESNWKK